MGLSESSVKLLSSFLLNRSQSVEHNTIKSDLLCIRRGVPQGSILGPLLFTVYVHKLPNVALSCFQHFYADDTQYYLSFSPEESAQAVAAINYDLQNLFAFCEKHCLMLNSSKSAMIVFGREKDRNQFKETYANHV